MRFSPGSFLRRGLSRLARIPESSHEIARAFAVGVFIGFAPGMGLAVALLVAWRFRLSKAAITLGALTNNPWTSALIYGLGYRLGRWFLGSPQAPDWRRILSFRNFSWEEAGRLAPPLILGTVALALAAAGAAYVAARLFVESYRRYRIKRRTLN